MSENSLFFSSILRACDIMGVWAAAGRETTLKPLSPEREERTEVLRFEDDIGIFSFQLADSLS